MSFGDVVVLELARVTGGVVAEIAVEQLLFFGLIPELLGPRALLLVSFCLVCFELRSGIDALLFVVGPAIGDVLGFDVICDLL